MRVSRIQKLTIVLLSMLLIFSAVFGILSVPQLPTASAANHLTHQTVWGGKDITQEYYNNSSNMDIQSIMNTHFDTTKLSKAKPVKIAIIDTGLSVNEDNEELFMGLIPIDSTSPTKDWMAYNVKDNTSGRLAVKDIESNVLGAMHGTSVASIIAMQIKAAGLQDYIKIIPIKANDGPQSNEFSPSVFQNALDKAIEIKADVINISLGLLNYNNSDRTDGWFNNPYMQQKLTRASENSIIIAAAGNDNKRYDTTIVPKESRAFYPAAYDNVISVMASKDGNERYDSSNYGEYDVVAPGDKIYAYTMSGAAPTWGYISGTSMAAPLVSAFAAMYKTKILTLFPSDKVPSPNIIAKAIINTTKDPIVMPTQTLHVKEGNNIVDRPTQYKLNKIDCKKLIEREDYSGGFEYLDPTGLYVEVVEKNGFLGEGKTLTGYLSNELKLRLRAKLLPIDLIDPNKEKDILWYVQYSDRNTEEIGNGSEVTFVPTKGGDQKIICAYKLGDKYIEKTFTILALYQEFDSSKCRITTIDKINLSHEDAAIKNQKITTYQNDTIVLGLTGLQYVDRSHLEVQWAVDGKVVGTGLTFEYKPKDFGDKIVQAYIRDTAEQLNPKFEKVPDGLKLDVKCFMEKPLAIFSMVIIIGLLIAVTAVVIVVVKRNKIAKKLK